MQSNAALRFHFTPIRTAARVKQMTVNADRNMKKEKLSSRLVRMNNCLVATMQITMLSPQNIEINYHMTQLYPLQYIPKVLNMLQECWHICDHCQTTETIQKAEPTKMWSIYIIQFYAAIMTNTKKAFVDKRDTTLNPHVKQSQTQKETTT